MAGLHAGLLFLSGPQPPAGSARHGGGMTHCRKFSFFLPGLGCLGGLALVLALAGFVPQRESWEVRRKVSGHVASLHADDMPAPIAHSGSAQQPWAVRLPAGDHPPPEDVPQLPTFSSGRGGPVVVFVPGGAYPDTGGGMPPGSLAENFAPLLALDGRMPHLLVRQPQGYGDALDARGRPVRWQASAALLGGYAPLPATSRDSRDAHAGEFFSLAHSGRVPGSAGRYRELVENFAQRYGLDVDLVYAIIHSESNFSTTLVSHKSAMGLMQLMPDTAGGEVHRYLYGKSGVVSFEELSVPEINIRYGTTYLHLLFSRYFGGVCDARAREYCVVAAYNMGPNRFLRFYGQSGAEAVERINAMSPAELYEDITARLPVRETRFYLAKVQRMKEHYAMLR